MPVARAESWLEESQRRPVAAFWLVALLGPVGAALVVRLVSDSLSPLVSTLVIALAMPAPLIAAMVVGGRRPRALLQSLQAGFVRPVMTLLLPVVGALAWVLAALAFTGVLGNVAGVEGVGRIPGDTETVRANLAELLDAETAAAAEIPPVPVLVLLAVGGGIVAGFTLNGLLAFGEEYGWRGYLWERLEPRGRPATIGAIGALWGLWHAPLILVVGFNYPDDRLAGVVAMTAFTVAMSWPLDELRRATGSPVAPAILHGAINGTAGLFVLLTGGDRLWAAPMGLLGAAAFLPAGIAIHRLVDRTLAREQRPADGSLRPHRAA